MEPQLEPLGIHPDGSDAPTHTESSPMPSGFTLQPTPLGFVFMLLDQFWRPLTFPIQPSSPLPMFATPYAAAIDLCYSHCTRCGFEWKAPDPPNGKCIQCKADVKDGRLSQVPSLSQSSDLPLPDILAAAANGYRQEVVGISATPPPARREPPATPAKETQSLPEGILCSALPGDQPGTWHHHVYWVINAKKLDTTDRGQISSSFKIPISDKDPEASFKLAFYAKESFLAKGGRGLKKARGKCRIELKANHVFQGEVTCLNLRFMVGSCDRQKIQIRPEHGHVTHDFRERNVATLPKDMQEWSIKDYVDQATQKFIVSVEVRGLSLQGSQNADR